MRDQHAKRAFESLVVEVKLENEHTPDHVVNTADLQRAPVPRACGKECVQRKQARLRGKKLLRCAILRDHILFHSFTMTKTPSTYTSFAGSDQVDEQDGTSRCFFFLCFRPPRVTLCSLKQSTLSCPRCPHFQHNGL